MKPESHSIRGRKVALGSRQIGIAEIGEIGFAGKACFLLVALGFLMLMGARKIPGKCRH
jgi:hypothetical protein